MLMPTAEKALGVLFSGETVHMKDRTQARGANCLRPGSLHPAAKEHDEFPEHFALYYSF